MIVLIIVATVVGVLSPSVARQLTHSRINRAANVVAADFYLAQSLAGRQRAPVRVVFDTSAKTTTLRTITNTVLQRRFYGPEGAFKLPVFSASPDSVQVLPNGMTNASITVSLSDGTYTRRVRMSRAGQIRVLSN